ncbi:MAG: T9SS type A sorting domain-containing protein [Flavobacteriales bacterium]|nr:T9SS type A sorting domain-containing protein [Flavobacteriales bacterium]
MRTRITFLTTAAMLLLSVASYAQCTTAAATWNDLNTAGGAPCFDGNSCAITDPGFSTIGIYGSEAYLLNDVQAGADYVFDMCSGFGAGAWIPAITIVAPSGAVDAFNLGTVGDFAANCSLSRTATESGVYSIVIHRTGDPCGTAFNTDNGNPTVTCGASPALCAPPSCDVSASLDVSLSPLTLCPGEAFDLVTDGSESTLNAYGIYISPQAGASGGLNGPTTLAPVASFPVTGIDNDLGGLLSANSLPPLEGTWAFYIFAQADMVAPYDSICSLSADSMMVTFLTAAAPQCAPCDADAGTLTADVNPVCLLNGSAIVSASVGTAPTVPSGYQVTYGLVDANGVIQQISPTASFTVTALGSWSIHTLVYDPTTLNLALFVPGFVTLAQVNGQLIQGGGTICASLYLTGAVIDVIDCNVENNLCGDAITVSCGDVVTGSTVGADNSDNPGICDTDLSTAPGVWYVFAGNGDVVTASLCGSAFDTKIGVFTGVCGDFICVAGNDDACGVQSEVNFLSATGTDYYIYVTGYQALAGDFSLSITCATPPVNNLCSGALAIDCGQTINGSTATATPEALLGTCGTDLTDSPGLWYVLAGTGNDVTVSLCGSEFDTKLGVFEGDCNSLVCVDGNDDSCGLQSELTVSTTSGTDYYIYVTGYNNASGNFSLNVSCNCEADAGTLTAVNAVQCLTNGSANLSATANGDAVVPAGFQTVYVLSQGAGLIIIDAAATPDFTVTAGGNYTIHTLVFDPLTLDISSVQFGVTTGFDVDGMLIQGGGNICGSLDVSGALFVVEAPFAGTLSVPDPQTCLINGSGTINASANGDAVVPAGYAVLYGLADASGTIQQIGGSSVFTVSATGNYTVHTLVYDPNTLDASLFVPGFVTVSMVQTAVGTVCASFDATGVAIEVINCAQCDADAGTITAVESAVCFENGSVDISAIWNNDGNVPSGYQVAYVLTEGTGLTVVDVNMVSPDFTVTAVGNYTIHTVVIDPLTGTPLLSASTGYEANNLLIQGGGVICGALDMTGAAIAVTVCPVCEANAGTISASQPEVCLTNGTATLSATPGGNAVVPAGFQTLYVLTQGAGLVILNASPTPNFVVNAFGVYTIHTLVYDPLTLDVSSVVFGTTTGFDVNALLEQGGGSICGSLDMTGAAFTVVDCTVPCAGVTAGSLVTSSPIVCLFEGSAVLAAVHTVNPTYPIGYDVLYVLTEGAGLTIVATSNFAVFTVAAGGNYTIHTLVYDPNTLNPANSTTGLQIDGLLLQGGGSICGALDVTGVAVYVPALESTIGVLLNDGDSLYLENAQTAIDFQWFFNGNPIPGATGSSYVIEESGNYAIQYTGQNGCIQSSATLPFTYSGGNISVGEQSVFRSVVLFPNPNNGQFSLRGELETATDVSIIVMDVTGRQVMPAVVLSGAQNFTQSIDVTAVANGFYFVRVQAADGEMTIRFAKQ